MVSNAFHRIYAIVLFIVFADLRAIEIHLFATFDVFQIEPLILFYHYYIARTINLSIEHCATKEKPSLHEEKIAVFSNVYFYR